MSMSDRTVEIGGEAFRQWVYAEARRTGRPFAEIWVEHGGPTGEEEREVARLSADVSRAAGELLTELAGAHGARAGQGLQAGIRGGGAGAARPGADVRPAGPGPTRAGAVVARACPAMAAADGVNGFRGVQQFPCLAARTRPMGGATSRAGFRQGGPANAALLLKS
jgi:hypothetical protein